MTRILFICHGNICRSTMAQFVMTDLVNKAGLSEKFYIDSKATSTEEIGNPPHHGTVNKLRQMNIPVLKHRASQMTKADYDNFDLIIGMDEWNYRNIMGIIKNDPDQKVSLLLDYTNRPGQIADPWYTGNFDQTFTDVMEGCQGLLNKIIS
ncbi:low molecular weight protein-tyrosine-phosphatase [Treponema sp.]|uniref:low molecular weight protein-tyrosine-phosphatase n=1 Tax=Treponema sp. TaxID=166 RepID=UPI0025F5B344|nr:low molecular weight protein-tyrosine-phosphatase [Treponema sp.]MCR5218493.1 low molecular weight phosphotyrosine protein phosphatase [Treponema sp.]